MPYENQASGDIGQLVRGPRREPNSSQYRVRKRDFPSSRSLALHLPISDSDHSEVHTVAVGTIIADRLPHRTVRAALPCRAPTFEDGRGVPLLAPLSSPGTLVPRAVSGIGVGLSDVLLGPGAIEDLSCVHASPCGNLQESSGLSAKVRA